MRLNTLVAVAVAAAFAVPLSTQAQSDKPSSGTSGATTPESEISSTPDKDRDGSISREEAKGTPYEKDFDKLDKNSDGKLSETGSGAGATGGSTAPKKQ